MPDDRQLFKTRFFNNFFMTVEFFHLPQNLFNCQGLKEWEKYVSDVKTFVHHYFIKIIDLEHVF